MSHGAGMFGGLTSRQVAGPLWFILAGGLICCLAVGLTLSLPSLNDWKLHLALAPIGAILITLGVWRLARIDMGDDYLWLMRFILAVSVLQIVATVVNFFPLPDDPVIALARIFIGFASIVAAVGFCIGMRWFCQDTRLWRSAKGWLRTTVVFCCSSVLIAVCECLLLIVVLKIAEIQPFSSNPPNWSWSWWHLLLVPFIVGPPLALGLTILQMHREMVRRELHEPDIIASASPVPPGFGE